MLASHGRYPGVPFTSRPDFQWPERKRLAVYRAIKVEHFPYGEPGGIGLNRPTLPWSQRSWLWRNYGNRVGGWKLLDLFTDLRLPIGVIVNTANYHHNPELLEAHRQRGTRHLPASACPSMPEEQSTVTPWQRLTIYCYTLPPPYEATEYLFEELPLSTYPSGTTMEPLAYEMAPGAYLGRAAPWNQALVLFPPRELPGMAEARTSGMSFREACARGYLRPYAPQRVPDV